MTLNPYGGGNRPCTYCSNRAGPFSHLCSAHANRSRRRGHPLQHNITRADLRPYTKMVQVRRFKNIDNPVWSTLQTRWDRLHEEAVGIVNQYDAGKPMITHRKLAADEVVRLYKTATFEDIMETTLGMVMMWQLASRLFEDDWSFRVQLVRLVVRCSKANIQTYDSGKRAARDIAPKTMQYLSDWILEVFGLNRPGIAGGIFV